MLLERTLRNSKRSKDLVQPHQSTTSLIMHSLDYIKEDQRANFGSTHTVLASSNTIFWGPYHAGSVLWYWITVLLQSKKLHNVHVSLCFVYKPNSLQLPCERSLPFHSLCLHTSMSWYKNAGLESPRYDGFLGLDKICTYVLRMWIRFTCW